MPCWGHSKCSYACQLLCAELYGTRNTRCVKNHGNKNVIFPNFPHSLFVVSIFPKWRRSFMLSSFKSNSPLSRIVTILSSSSTYKCSIVFTNLPSVRHPCIHCYCFCLQHKYVYNFSFSPLRQQYVFLKRLYLNMLAFVLFQLCRLHYHMITQSKHECRAVAV